MSEQHAFAAYDVIKQKSLMGRAASQEVKTAKFIAKAAPEVCILTAKDAL